MDNNVLAEQLINLLSKEQAHASLENSLKGLKTENRAMKPNINLHSVWDELEHIRISQEDILKYMVDPEWRSPKWPDEYWPAATNNVTDAEWEKSVDACINDRNELIKIIKEKGNELSKVIPHTESHTYLRELLIAAQHNSYHIAQIVLIRKMLDDWK